MGGVKKQVRRLFGGEQWSQEGNGCLVLRGVVPETYSITKKSLRNGKMAGEEPRANT